LTIALSIKINDGIVLAADSASTNTSTFKDGTTIKRIYNNANKILHMHRDIPAGIITWGNGSIGNASIATIVKDFRSQLGTGITFDPTSYQLKDLAEKFNDFIQDKYCAEYHDIPIQFQPYTGFTISGYSSNSSHAEEWRLNLESINKVEPVLLSNYYDSGINWAGQPEAISRLINGYTRNLKNILLSINNNDNPSHNINEELANLIIDEVRTQASSPIINQAMPIQDAIDIAEFLVDMTAKFGKYTMGDDSVGGPIEIAAITKHEGFKWVKRKLYYTNQYNF
jgi:hypothetical protein